MFIDFSSSPDSLEIGKKVISNFSNGKIPDYSNGEIPEYYDGILSEYKI
jgi:hypothetical protein